MCNRTSYQKLKGKIQGMYRILFCFYCIFYCCGALVHSGNKSDTRIRRINLVDIPDIQLLDSEQQEHNSECGTRSTTAMLLLAGREEDYTGLLLRNAYRPRYNRRRGRVIGGEDAPYGAFPWQVQIQIFNYDKKQFEHQCGGALIADRIVVTAAHCLHVSKLEYLRLVLGQHILHERDLFEHGYRVDAFLMHPDYRKRGPYSNDIGLLRVQTPHKLGIAFNSHVRTICLPKSGEMPPVGTRCMVSGWGANNPNDVHSIDGILRAATVPIMDLNTCRKDSINGGRTQKILDTMLCAGFLKGGIDACGGDSGGPLACELRGKFVLNGIVSWGDGCAKKNRPGVYTRIDAFVDWIQDSIKELQ